jgi:hypothetical protein
MQGMVQYLGELGIKLYGNIYVEANGLWGFLSITKVSAAINHTANSC